MKVRYKYTLLKAALAAAAVGYLVYVVEVDRLVTAAQEAHSGWIVAALALLPLNLFLEAASWHLLVRREMPGVRWKASWASLMAGHALGLPTPARLGEYAGRAFALAHRDRGTLVAMVLADRLAAKFAGVGVGLFAFIIYVRTHPPASPALWWGAAAYGAGVAAVLAALLLSPRGTHRLLKRILPFARVQRHAGFLAALNTRRMLPLLALALLRYGVYVTQFVLLLRAFAPGFDPFTAYLGIAVVFFAKFLLPPVTLLDLGIREGAAVFFLTQLGYGAAAAFNAAFLLFCVNLLAPAVLGVPFVLRLHLHHPPHVASEAA